MVFSIIAILVVVILALYIIFIYNNLVKLNNRFENAFSQIEIQLKRRYDLIPNLIEVAKGYLKHEKETLEAVISARNQAITGLEAASANPGNAGAMKQLAGAENVLGSALGKFNMVMEDYPDLKANETMMQLSEELTTTENRIAFARQSFNDSVEQYNTFKQSFPPVLFAKKFGHSADAQLLEFADSQAIQNAPKVSF